MCELDSVGGSGSGGDGSTESKKEATADEVSHFVRRGLDSSSDQYKRASNEDTQTAAVSVSKKTAEREGCNLSQVVDDEDDTGAGALSG